MNLTKIPEVVENLKNLTNGLTSLAASIGVPVDVQISQQLTTVVDCIRDMRDEIVKLEGQMKEFERYKTVLHNAGGLNSVELLTKKLEEKQAIIDLVIETVYEETCQCRT